MSSEQDLLASVVERLKARQGDLRRVADMAGVAYDTVLRIKNGEGDPGYSKVRRLHDALLGTEGAPEAPAEAKA